MKLLKKIEFVKTIAAANIFPPKKPFKLNFSITGKCNSMCKTCYLWKKRAVKEMTLEEINSLFSKNPFFQWISLTGGEPFLRNDLVEICNIAKKHCKNLALLSIPTNGIQTSKIVKDVQEIIKLKIPMFVVTVSIDGPRKEHDWIRGVKCWKKSTRTLARLMELRNRNFSVFPAYTISPFNMGLFAKTVKAVQKEIPEIKASDFQVNIFHRSAFYANEGIKIEKNFNKKVVGEIDKISTTAKFPGLNPAKLLSRLYLRIGKKCFEKNQNLVKCSALKSSIHINSQGNVFPCTMSNRAIGNLAKANYDLTKIINSKEAKSALERIQRGECGLCWTPCEAFQSIATDLLESILKSI